MVYDGKTPIGFFAYKINKEDVEIKTMAVLPQYQRKAIGRMMMKKLLQLTKGKCLNLVTHPQNSQAIIFYLKSGFEIYGRVDNYFGDGKPRLKLRRGRFTDY